MLGRPLYRPLVSNAGTARIRRVKHVKTGNDRSVIRPLKSEEVITRPPVFYGVAVYDLSLFDDAVGGVTIENEPEQDLLEVVKRAAGYLRTKIA